MSLLALRQVLLLKVLPALAQKEPSKVCGIRCLMWLKKKQWLFFDLSNDTAKKTRKTSRVVQDLPQNTITPNQTHAEADLLPLSSHPLPRDVFS